MDKLRWKVAGSSLIEVQVAFIIVALVVFGFFATYATILNAQMHSVHFRELAALQTAIRTASQEYPNTRAEYLVNSYTVHVHVSEARSPELVVIHAEIMNPLTNTPMSLQKEIQKK